MAAIDIVVLLLLVMFGVVGWKQGIIKEAVQLVGMIIILVIAFMFKGELGNIFCKWLPFFNFNLFSSNVILSTSISSLSFLFVYNNCTNAFISLSFSVFSCDIT